MIRRPRRFRDIFFGMPVVVPSSHFSRGNIWIQAPLGWSAFTIGCRVERTETTAASETAAFRRTPSPGLPAHIYRQPTPRARTVPPVFPLGGWLGDVYRRVVFPTTPPPAIRHRASKQRNASFASPHVFCQEDLRVGGNGTNLFKAVRIKKKTFFFSFFVSPFQSGNALAARSASFGIYFRDVLRIFLLERRSCLLSSPLFFFYSLLFSHM